MSPPNLATDAPVANVLQPLRVNFFPVRRKETDEMIAHNSECFLCFWIFEKPLLAYPRFDWHIAAIAKSHIVFVGLRFGEQLSIL